MPRSFSQRRASAAGTSTTGTVKIVPREARITFGLLTSVTGSQTSTASTAAASAERRIADQRGAIVANARHGAAIERKCELVAALDGHQPFAHAVALVAQAHNLLD